jgi:hypothetical protein
MNIPILDNDDANAAEYFPDAIQFLESVVLCKGKVSVTL